MRKGIKFSFITVILSICLLLAGSLFNLFSMTTAFADSNVAPTLHEETKIYRVNDNAFEGAARETQYANQTAKITVLTHGYGGDPYQLSNVGTEEFAYNECSIISALAVKTKSNGGVNVYYAREGKKLHKLSADNYVFYTGTKYSPIYVKEVDMIDDVSKHIVLIYEASNPQGGHKEVYNEFHTLLDTISAQYKSLTGLLPIYNLIGHSRGGITNLMFATEHPYNVDKVMSVGTPYRGSRLGMIDGILEFSGMLENVNDPKPQGMLDILSESTPQYETQLSNPTTAVELRDAWNSVYAQGVRANIISIGTMMDVGAISTILEDATVSSYVDSNIISILQKVIELADNVPGLVEFTLDFVDGLASVLQFFGVNDLGDLGIEADGWSDADITACRKILELVKNINGNLVIADDLFIDTDSQLGQGFADAVSYTGFSRMVKVLTAEDVVGSKSEPHAPPIGHNIEAMNLEIVSFISNSLVCGFANDNILQISEEFQGTYTDVQTFRIQTQYSGTREILISNGTLSMYKYTDTGLKYCEVSGNDISNFGTFTYNLKNDEVYLLVVKPNYLSAAQFACRHANTIIVGNNQIKYENDAEQSFKLVFNDNYFYNLSCKVEGAYFNVYNSNWVLLQSGEGEVSIETGRGEILFVTLFLPNEINDYVDVECVKERKVEFIDNKFDKFVEPMSFINDVGGNFEVLSEIGYIFNGWTRTGEDIVLASDIAEINQATVILHSSWSAVIYQIIYEENGGAEIPNGRYSLDEGCGLPAADKMLYDGYVFVGWYENANYSGEPITWVGNRTGEVTLYARWAQETYVLNDFSANISSIDNQNYTTSEGVAVENFAISVNYGEYFELPTLSSTCFGFQGWYYGDERITDEQGHSYMPYTYVGIMPLEARWYRDAIKFRLTENNRFEIYLISDGLAEAIFEIPYIENLSPNDIISQLRISTDTEMYDAIFTYLYRDGYKYECLTVDKEWTEIAGGQTIEYLDEGNEILLYPKYVREEYTIYFHFLERNDVQVVHFGEAIQYPIDTDYMLAFYTIDGWYNVSNNVKFTENNWPDLTPNDENNGSLYLELRGNYKTFNVTWEVPALTYDGKAIDTALYNLNVGTTSYTYFMTINAGTIDSVAYELLGWYESSTFEESSLLNEAAIRHYGDRTFYAKLKMKQYTITFNSNGGTSCASMTVDYGSTITLPISTKSNYKGSWNTWTMDGNLPVSNFGDEHTVLQNKSFTVSWKRYYNIVYRNLVFMGQTAEVLWDNWLYVDAPNYYFYGYTFELERASAYMQADGPYDEHLRFLGWYTSMSFVTKKTSISSSQTGTVYVYAKWRYDFNYGGRYGTNTVTDASQMNQEYDQLYLGLGYDNLHQELLNIGIKSVTITFKINMWRTADQGTQYIYFYGGSDGTTLLQQYSFTVGTTETVKTINFAFDLESLGTINYIYVRYKASTSGWWLWEKSDTWKNDKTHYEIVYVAQEADKNALEFYWSYKDPFD